jgi:LPXTG-motif cell wall-anchored protein
VELNPPIKRLLALAGSLAAGMFGAIVLVSPAQAHETTLEASFECLPDGRYKTEWTVKNGDYPNPVERLTLVVFKIDDVAPPADTLKTIKKDAEIQKNGELHETVLVPGTTKKVSLQVKSVWLKPNGSPSTITDDKHAKVMPLGTCVPGAKGESTCTTFDVTVANSAEGPQETTATVKYGTQSETVTLKKGESKKVNLTPSSQTEAVVTFSTSDLTVKVPYNKPANCGGLPVTGSGTTTIMASGAGLAGLGVFVFFLARRRLARLRRLATE